MDAGWDGGMDAGWEGGMVGGMDGGFDGGCDGGYDATGFAAQSMGAGMQANAAAMGAAMHQAAPAQPQFQQLHQQQPQQQFQMHAVSPAGGELKKSKPRKGCWYWEHGCCSKGRSCTFPHIGPPGSAGPADLTQSGQPCWFYMRGACTKGLSCPFQHGDQSARSPSFAALLSQQNPNAATGSVWGSNNPADFFVGEDQMQIPKSVGRSIIGPGGENVKLLQQVTGCKVIIDLANVGPDGQQTVRLMGIPAQREHAKALIEQQRQAEERIKTLKYEPDEPAEDSIYTSVKVALSSAGIDEEEDAVETARVRAKITTFARQSAEEVDTSGHSEPLDAIIRQICRNFFAAVCPVFYERKWLSNVDFQLVMDAAIKELVPASLLRSMDAAKLEETIWESHDIAFEEQRFLPSMWEIVRPLVDGPKIKKKVYKAVELGRYQALTGSDEGAGLMRADAFLRAWATACLAQMAEDSGGDPEALIERSKVLEIFFSLMCVPDKNGFSAALPSRWTIEAGIPENGWMPVLESVLEDVYATFKVEAEFEEAGKNGKGFKKGGGGKGGWGGSSYGAAKGSFIRPAKGKGWGGKDDFSAEPFDAAPASAGWAPRPASAFVRRTGPYGQA
eukprot:TRINITY_DN2880_c0_g2_i1.p1 TRINITY_DN2880_c0_g2~~TRINITY_DN2880_c0_g2_i1.p1  ORF type:complete len:665 (-),score=158.37 TRINITY_DN2880_c0_g2_i1:44-1894(-)